MTEQETTAALQALEHEIADMIAEGFDPSAIREALKLIGAELTRQQTFTYEIPGRTPLVWDVNAAFEAVARGEIDGWTELPPEALAHIARANVYDEAAVERADPTAYGIAVEVRHSDGRDYSILIDGTHRAVKAYRDGVPFRAVILTRAAARACMLEGLDCAL